MWHNNGYEEIESKDYRAGRYLVYYADTLDYIINSNDWVFNNDAFDEQEYVIDHLDMMLESEDGETVYIPDAKTAMKIETEREILELETTTW